MARGLARLISQYQGDPIMEAILNAVAITPEAELRAEAEALLRRLSIDDMEGVNLDIIGKYVGFPRPISFQDEQAYFDGVFTLSNTTSLIENDSDQGLADDAAPLIGGELVDEREFLQMADPDYRLFLKAAIVRNNSKNTWQDIEEVTRILYGTAQAVDISTVGQVTVTVPITLNPQAEEITKSVMPIADGIKLILQEAP